MKKKQKRKGFTLIEAVVGVFLLAILSMGIYVSYAFGIKMSVQNRLRVEATAVAEKRIEAIRAMKYADIGVQGGIPTGLLMATTTENSNGTIYTVKTSVRYIDDPLDNKFPQDTTPTDYKQVEIKVSWSNNMEAKNIVLNTLVAPPKVETGLGMGVLMVNTVDGTGTPITNCQVHIKNSVVNPPIDVTEETDSNGSLTLPGVPTTTSNSYEITVSKSNYEMVKTYPPYPTSTFNPIDVNMSVSQGALTSKVFIIDLTSHQHLHFTDTHGANLPNLTFSLTGGRVIGTTVGAAPKPVYFYNETSLVSNASGVWESPAIGKGPYTFSISNPNYELITTSLVSPWSVAANTTVPVEITMGSKTENILVVSVKETNGQTPIVEALVRLTDPTGIFFQESLTNVNGIAYFPKVEDPVKSFVPGINYNIDVTKTGYTLNHSTTSISRITRKTVILSK